MDAESLEALENLAAGLNHLTKFAGKRLYKGAKSGYAQIYDHCRKGMVLSAQWWSELIDVLFRGRPAGVPSPVDDIARQKGITREKLLNLVRDDIGLEISHFNFGIAGRSRNGKSSLTNALCSMQDWDEGAAKTSADKETTMKVKAYRRKGSHAVFWDLPGAATSSHPSATYFFDKHLYAFDCILYVVETAQQEADIKILEDLKAANIPVLYVRTKADLAQDDRMRRPLAYGGAASLEDAAKIVRDEYNPHFADKYGPDKLDSLFHVNCRAFFGSSNAEPLKYHLMDEIALLTRLHAVVEDSGRYGGTVKDEIEDEEDEGYHTPSSTS